MTINNTAVETLDESARFPQRWKKGKCPNPGGRPKRTAEELDLITACKQKTPEALGTVVELMQNSKNERVRLSAAQYVIDRGWGKAPLVIEHDPIKVEISRNIDPADAYIQMLEGGVLEGVATVVTEVAEAEAPDAYAEVLAMEPKPATIDIDTISLASVLDVDALSVD